MSKSNFKNGLTSNKVRVFIPDTTSVIGAGKTGLTFSSSGLIISTIADNEATATTYTQAGSTIETISTLGTFAAPTATKCRFKEVDATNHPGIYEIQIADARFAVSSARSLIISLPPVSGLGTGAVRAEIQLEAVDNQDAVRSGLTALPNAAAEAAGGLYTRGSGAGQIAQDANGRINANLLAILGTTLTETAGQIAAAFKQFFDVASPTGTMKAITNVVTTITTTNLTTNNDKTGYALSSGGVQAIWDALTSALTTTNSIGKLLVDKIDTVLSTIYSRIGAPAGASISADVAAVKTDTAASQTSESTLLSRLSSARAGYMDNLNVGGNVASSAEVVGIQNNTRVVRVVNDVFERPDSGSTAFRVELLIYDEVGNMEAPDSAPTISVVNQAGTSRDANLDSTTMSLVSTGRYRSTYTIDTAHVLEQLVFSFSVVEGSATRVYANPAQVVDTTAVDFTATDRTNLGAIKTQTDLLAFTSGKVNAQVKAIDADAITAAAIATDAIDADAIKTDAVTEFQSGLSTLTASGVRSAIGLASANLDTQLGAIDDYIDTEVAAIKAKTDLIPAAPAAVGDIPAVGAIADAVWDEAVSGHLTTGTTGKELHDIEVGADGATAAEVWAYGARTLTTNARVTVISPYNPDDTKLYLVKGDSYDERPIVFEDGGNWPDLTDATVDFNVFDNLTSLFTATTVISGDDPETVSVALTSEQTDDFVKSTGRYNYTLVATIGDLTYTLAFSTINVVH